MKKFIFVMGASLSLAAIVFAMSCQKNHSPSPQKAEKQIAVTQLAAFPDMPSVVNGMLVFNDTSQFYSYLDYLDNTMEDPDNGDIDDDSLLLQIETGIGFHSLRAIKYNDFIAVEEGEGWATREQAAKSQTWVPKDIASVLNVDHDVKVGSNIIHFINSHLQVVVAEGNDEILNQFQNLDTTASVEDALKIDAIRNVSSVFDYEFGGIFVQGSIPIHGSPTSTGPLSNNYSIVGPQQSISCGHPTRVVFKHLSLFANGSIPPTYVTGTYHIDFGDGTSTNVSSGSVTSYFVPEFYHDYPTYGNYTMTITAVPSGYTTNNYVQDTRFVPVNQSECKLSNKDYGSDWNVQAIDGSHWLYGKVSIHHITAGSFNIEKTRVYTDTKLIKKKNNGNYTRYKGKKNHHEICHKKDNNCNTYGNPLEGDGTGKKKTLHMHRTADGVFYFSQLRSSHHDDNGHTVDIYFHPCD